MIRKILLFHFTSLIIILKVPGTCAVVSGQLMVVGLRHSAIGFWLSTTCPIPLKLHSEWSVVKTWYGRFANIRSAWRKGHGEMVSVRLA